MKRAFLILIFAAFLLSACGGGGGGAAPSVNSDDSPLPEETRRLTPAEQAEVRTAANRLRSDLDSLENNAEADSLRQEIDALIADINTARHTIEELQNEIANLRSEIDTLKVAETQTEPPPLNCGANEEIIGGNCECISGYVRQNGVCELPPPNCDANEMADGQNCVCISGYVRQNGVCELPPPNCGANEIADGQNCVCISGYVRQNGVCELPPPNCGANEIADGQNCVCVSGYVRQNGACELPPPNCGANEMADGQNCKCISGYVRKNNICEPESPPLNCGANEEESNGICKCISGYVQQNGACELPPPNCGANEEIISGSCECISGYVQQNGVCELPPPNCGANEMADGQNCVCISGYVRKNNICEPESPPLNCGTNEEIIGGSCECISGYVRQNGVCELPPPNCGANEIADGQNCVCISGYVRKNNICEPESPPLNCGANEVESGGSCKCISGYVRKDGVCVVSAYNTDEYQRSAALSFANVLPAYEADAFGQGVTVIVLEGRTFAMHKDIAPNLITADTTLVGVDERYGEHTHGTAVAGVLGAAFGNAESTHGVAPSVKMWATGYEGNNGLHLQHIPFAIERTIKIVNRSHNIFGIFPFQTEADAMARDDLKNFAAEYAAMLGDADIVEVLAAGNHPPPLWPQRAAYAPVLAPDTEDNMLVVINIKENEEEPADTSKVCKMAKRWCLAAHGDGIWAPNKGGGYSDFTGTSAATPVVSGALALLKSFRPELKMTVIRQVLLESARPLGTRKNDGMPDEVFGWGAVDVGNGIATLQAMQTADGMAYSDLRKSLPGEFSHLRGRMESVSVALRITDRSYYNMRLSDIVGGGDSDLPKTSLGNAAKEMQADDSLSPENSGFGFNYANGDYDLHYAGGGNENTFRFSGGLRHDDSQSSYIGEGSSPFAAENASDTGGYVKWTTKNYGGISAFGEYGRTQIKADYDSASFISQIQNARAEEWTAGFQYRDLFLHNDNLQFSARQESRISGGEMVLHYPVADGDSHKAFIGESVQTIRTETAKIPIKQKPQTIYTAGYSQKTENSKWSAAAEWNSATNAKGFSFAVELQIR